jgi:hypothetical protein
MSGKEDTVRAFECVLVTMYVIASNRISSPKKQSAVVLSVIRTLLLLEQLRSTDAIYNSAWYEPSALHVLRVSPSWT